MVIEFSLGVAVVEPGTQWVDQNEWKSEGVTVHNPPQFTGHLQKKVAEEGGRCYFEARILPKDDPHLKIEWYKDGVPLQMGKLKIWHSAG